MNEIAPLVLTEPKREQLLTVQEFAALIRVHPRSVYRRIAEQRQPGLIQVGREYRINVTVALAPPIKPRIV